MRVFVVRHGETDWNVEGRFQGQMDTKLNARGVKQAELLAERLKNHKFDAVLTSPLSRARVTAEMIAAKAGIPEVTIIKELTEINHGDWEGCLADEISSKWPEILKKWHTNPEMVKMPGVTGESLEDIGKRCVLASERALFQYEGDVLLASHDAVIKVLLCRWLDAPLSSFWRFQIPNCSITVVEFLSDRTPRLLLMGDASHLGDAFDRPEQKGL